MENRVAIVQAVMANDGSINILTMGEAPNKLAALQALLEKVADQTEIDGKSVTFEKLLQLLYKGHAAFELVSRKEGQE